MTNHVSVLARRDTAKLADKALKAAAKLWFAVAVIGMWIFVYYIVAYYGGAVVQGDLAVLPQGFVPGDTLGNLAIGMHLFIAAYIIGFGPLQIMLGALITTDRPLHRFPQIRTYARPFHRWNGRIYLPTVILTSLAGLYLVWIRGVSNGDLIGHLGVSLDAILIIIFAVLVLRYALARDFETHRRWALRLFLVVSAVWFFRIGVFGWIYVTGGVGITFPPLGGPFIAFWNFGQYLVPLAVLELYLRTQDRAGARGKFAMAGGLLIVTILMGIGIYAATMRWLPLL